VIPARIAGEARLDNRAELGRALAAPETSDLALILGAYRRWGSSCPARLIGDFAFVIEDARGRIAFGARDHLGVVPFCYRIEDGRLIFATSAREAACRGGPPSIDEARVADALIPALEALDTTSTFYADVRRLPAGHSLTLSGGRAAISRYWSPADALPRTCSDAEGIDAFQETFREAVRCRLDGPVASMLSGGLDSSAIVGFGASIRLASGEMPLPTVSAVTRDPDCEESRCARAVAASAGVSPTWIEPAAIGSYRPELDRFLAAVEPFDAAMIVPALAFAAARRDGAAVVLDGVDGDAVASIEPALLTDLLRRGALRAAGREARAIADFYRGGDPAWSSPARLLAGAGLRALAPGFAIAAAASLRRAGRVRDALAGSIVHPDLARRAGVAERLAAAWSHRRTRAPGDPRARHLREIAHPQIPAALERYDRVARSLGVRSRHPFLDKRVVELCLSLPWPLLVRDGWSKWIVRMGTAGLLPEAVRWRRGRFVRLGPRFLRAAIAAYDEPLADGMSAAIRELDGLVDAEKLRTAFARHRRDADLDAAETVWQAFHLANWLRRQREERYDPARGPTEGSTDDGLPRASEGAAEEAVPCTEPAPLRPPEGPHHRRDRERERELVR